MIKWSENRQKQQIDSEKNQMRKNQMDLQRQFDELKNQMKNQMKQPERKQPERKNQMKQPELDAGNVNYNPLERAVFKNQRSQHGNVGVNYYTVETLVEHPEELFTGKKDQVWSKKDFEPFHLKLENLLTKNGLEDRFVKVADLGEEDFDTYESYWPIAAQIVLIHRKVERWVSLHKTSSDAYSAEARKRKFDMQLHKSLWDTSLRSTNKTIDTAVVLKLAKWYFLNSTGQIMERLVEKEDNAFQAANDPTVKSLQIAQNIFQQRFTDGVHELTGEIRGRVAQDVQASLMQKSV